MKIIVQKFGGTSVSTEKRRQAAVSRVRRALEDGYRPVVVVSAMGRAGEPYATDTLKGLAENIYSRVSLRELDLLMSCGEIISAVVMAATLNRAGIKATALTGAQAGLVTDGFYSQAQVVSCDTARLKQCLEKEEVPVVAGFQGITPEGEVNTIGRGGSDTTAVILGVALRAAQVEIYTDVHGISTADPRILKEARVIPRLTFSEVSLLAYEGARVIHPAAVEVAMKHSLDVVVRSLTEEGPGTLINTYGAPAGSGFTVQPNQVVTGIAHSTDVVQIIIDFPEPDKELEMKIFESLAQARISIDLISVFPLSKIFTIKEEDLERAEEVLGVLKEEGINYRVEEECAKVSVVGVGMRGIPGVMAQLVRALNEQDITILQSSDSNISISLLINRVDLPKAVKTLHDHFNLGAVDEAYQVSGAK